MKPASIAVLMFASVAGAAEPERCVPLMGVTIPGGPFRPSHRNLQRVEVQRCSPGVADAIKIVAWPDGGTTPSVSINTGGGDVRQVFTASNTFIAEISGGSRNQVYTITYSAGKPTLALKRATAGRVLIRSNGHVVEVDVPNEWRNELERHSFPIEEK
jgi:hypothetical protein